MGSFTYPIGVSAGPDGPFTQLRALVDTGSFLTWLPSSVLRSLGVRPTGRQRFQMANGVVLDRDICRVWIDIDGRQEITLVVAGEEGDMVLLGAYTLEGFFLGVAPLKKNLVPLSPLPAA